MYKLKYEWRNSAVGNWLAHGHPYIDPQHSIWAPHSEHWQVQSPPHPPFRQGVALLPTNHESQLCFKSGDLVQAPGRTLPVCVGVWMAAPSTDSAERLTSTCVCMEQLQDLP